MTGEHAHGTPARYDHGTATEPPCRQACCRNAKNADRKRRRRQQAYGRPATVPAGPVAAHIRALRTAGMSARLIAASAGVSLDTVTKAHQKTMMRTAVAGKVLAVRAGAYPPDTLGCYLSALGTRRRIQGCVAEGWTLARIAAEAGTDRWTVQQLATRRLTVRALIARRIVVATDRLGVQRPPRGTWRDRENITHSQRLAARRGWVPLACWDNVDDPAETPKGVPKTRAAA